MKRSMFFVQQRPNQLSHTLLTTLSWNQPASVFLRQSILFLPCSYTPVASPECSVGRLRNFGYNTVVDGIIRFMGHLFALALGHDIFIVGLYLISRNFKVRRSGKNKNKNSNGVRNVWVHSFVQIVIGLNCLHW